MRLTCSLCLTNSLVFFYIASSTLALALPLPAHALIKRNVPCSYFDNFMTLKRGMAALGFTLYVPDGPAQGCIISTFLWPADPAFDFNGECWCNAVSLA